MVLFIWKQEHVTWNNDIFICKTVNWRFTCIDGERCSDFANSNLGMWATKHMRHIKVYGIYYGKTWGTLCFTMCGSAFANTLHLYLHLSKWSASDMWHTHIIYLIIYVYIYIYIYISCTSGIHSSNCDIHTFKKTYICMYVRMYVCTHVRLYVCTSVRLYVCTSIHLYVCTSVHLYVCMSVCMYACMHVCMCAFVHVCMYVCMCACMHVCMYACVYVCMYACMHACMHGRTYVTVCNCM